MELEGYNELNDLLTKTLVIELMGKHSNIILLNENPRKVIKFIATFAKIDIQMNVERDIAGFALPFAAGVLITAYAESLFCGDFPSINFYALLLIFMAVIPLLKSSKGYLSNLMFNKRATLYISSLLSI